MYPLEGIWSLNEEGIKSIVFNKDNLIYKLMIRQPDFVDNNLFLKALEKALKKNTNSLVTEVSFEELEDGLCVQMLHVGPYDDEPKSFELMNKFIANNNYQKRMFEHKEIYLSNFTKTEPTKLKTVLRYFIK